MTTSDTHRAIDAVWRIESAKLIAGLTRIVRDVGLAEDLAQDALLAALEKWPESGVPDNPGAWLMATAKHRAIDTFRRTERIERKHEELGHELDSRQELALADTLFADAFTMCWKFGQTKESGNVERFDGMRARLEAGRSAEPTE